MNNIPHSYLSFSVYYIYSQRWISIKITIYKLGGKNQMSKIVKAKCVASYVLKDDIFKKVLHDLRESMKDVTVEGTRSENKTIAFYEFQIDGEKNIFIPMLARLELWGDSLIQSSMAGAANIEKPTTPDSESFEVFKEDSKEEYLIMKVDLEDGGYEYLPMQKFGWSIESDPEMGEGPVMRPFVSIKTADSGLGVLL